ncbi:unnamed protein product [Amoebophrya sp. A25]|nr:unnamed protein product [Amoebophrya sp. A25]|eukprot:GSA25T00023272001.1
MFLLLAICKKMLQIEQPRILGSMTTKMRVRRKWPFLASFAAARFSALHFEAAVAGHHAHAVRKVTSTTTSSRYHQHHASRGQATSKTTFLSDTDCDRYRASVCGARFFRSRDIAHACVLGEPLKGSAPPPPELPPLAVVHTSGDKTMRNSTSSQQEGKQEMDMQEKMCVRSPLHFADRSAELEQAGWRPDLPLLTELDLNDGVCDFALGTRAPPLKALDLSPLVSRELARQEKKEKEVNLNNVNKRQRIHLQEGDSSTEPKSPTSSTQKMKSLASAPSAPTLRYLVELDAKIQDAKIAVARAPDGAAAFDLGTFITLLDDGERQGGSSVAQTTNSTSKKTSNVVPAGTALARLMSRYTSIMDSGGRIDQPGLVEVDRSASTSTSIICTKSDGMDKMMNVCSQLIAPHTADNFVWVAQEADFGPNLKQLHLFWDNQTNIHHRLTRWYSWSNFQKPVEEGALGAHDDVYDKMAGARVSLPIGLNRMMHKAALEQARQEIWGVSDGTTGDAKKPLVLAQGRQEHVTSNNMKNVQTSRTASKSATVSSRPLSSLKNGRMLINVRQLAQKGRKELLDTAKKWDFADIIMSENALSGSFEKDTWLVQPSQTSFLETSASGLLRRERFGDHSEYSGLLGGRGSTSTSGDPTTSADFYRLLSRYSFIACPRGAQPDTHRLYEALYMGVTPVMLKDPAHAELMDTWDQFPVVWLDSWDQLNDPVQAKKLLKESPFPKDVSYDRATLDYWVKRILGEKTSHDPWLKEDSSEVKKKEQAGA